MILRENWEPCSVQVMVIAADIFPGVPVDEATIVVKVAESEKPWVNADAKRSLVRLEVKSTGWL